MLVYFGLNSLMIYDRYSLFKNSYVQGLKDQEIIKICSLNVIKFWYSISLNNFKKNIGFVIITHQDVYFLSIYGYTNTEVFIAKKLESKSSLSSKIFDRISSAVGIKSELTALQDPVFFAGKYLSHQKRTGYFVKDFVLHCWIFQMRECSVIIYV